MTVDSASIAERKLRHPKLGIHIELRLSYCSLCVFFSGFCLTNYFQQHQEPYSLEKTDTITQDTNSICQASTLFQTEIDSLLEHGYVDLGLPSGTLWKAKNEVIKYEYDSAVKKLATIYLLENIGES